MTSIVGLIEDDIAYLGCDSLIVSPPSQYHSGVSQTIMREPKIFRKANMLIGASGDWLMVQILKYKLEIPEISGGKDRVEYLVNDFVGALTEHLKKIDYTRDGIGGNILIAMQGFLFTIGEYGKVVWTADNYDAIGKSSEVAVGSLHTTERLKQIGAGVGPLQRLQLALAATEHHTCVVAAPYHFISSGMDRAEILYDDPFNIP